MSFEVVMLTPIIKRKILIKEFFGFIKNHKSYGSLKFLSSEYFFSTSFQCSVCLGRGKAVICGEKIRFFPFFTRGCYFRGTKMVLISAVPYFRFVHFYAWFLFSREQNGSYFRAHIKNAKIWTREVLKRENEVRAKKWTFTVVQLDQTMRVFLKIIAIGWNIACFSWNRGHYLRLCLNSLEIVAIVSDCVWSRWNSCNWLRP